MKIQQHLQLIEKKNHPKWLVVFRIILGLSLFLKGIQFIENKTLLQKVVNETAVLNDYFWLQTLIPWINIFGGAFILIGLFTRFACLIQIPILIGAIVFVNSKTGLFAGESELAFSIIILSLLILFIVEGDGLLSWHKTIKKEEDVV